MKRIKNYFALLAILLLLSPLATSQSWKASADAIASDIAEILTTATATNGTDFTAAPFWISRGLDYGSVIGITITFTGDGSMDGKDVDFYFQLSFDGGTTYTTDDPIIVDCPSDETATATYVVRHFEQANAE